MTSNKSHIGSRLRSEREKRHMSVEALAEALRDAASERDRRHMPTISNITRMIRKWEAGEHQPRGLRRMLYCSVFNMTEDELFTERPKTTSLLSFPLDLAPQGAIELAAWIEETNLGSETLDFLEEEV